MKKIIFAGLMLLSSVVMANATVLDFEGIPNNTDYTLSIYSGYGGLNWNNIGAVNYIDDHYGSGYQTGAVSGTYTAYNIYGDMGITSSDANFDFNGAYFTSAWNDNNILTVQGYDDGNLVNTMQLTLNTSTPLWLDANFLSIDELRFSTSAYQFAMDNFTYNESAPVPEPGTIALLGLGMAGLAFYGKRRQKKA